MTGAKGPANCKSWESLCLWCFLNDDIGEADLRNISLNGQQMVYLGVTFNRSVQKLPASTNKYDGS